MQSVHGQALITILGDRSKVKFNRSYFVKIDQVAKSAFCAVYVWSSTHCHFHEFNYPMNSIRSPIVGLHNSELKIGTTFTYSLNKTVFKCV